MHDTRSVGQAAVSRASGTRAIQNSGCTDRDAGERPDQGAEQAVSARGQGLLQQWLRDDDHRDQRPVPFRQLEQSGCAVGESACNQYARRLPDRGALAQRSKQAMYRVSHGFLRASEAQLSPAGLPLRYDWVPSSIEHAVGALGQALSTWA